MKKLLLLTFIYTISCDEATIEANRLSYNASKKELYEGFLKRTPTMKDCLIEIIGDHPHKGRTATCVGISKKLFGDMYVFEYNIPWVGSKQFCVQSLTDVKWLT